MASHQPNTDQPAFPTRPPLRPQKGLRGLLGRLVKRAAKLLPPPRDEALLAMVRDGWALVRGYPIARAADGKLRPGEPFVDPVSLIRARNAYDRGEYDKALARLEPIVEQHPRSFRALQLKRDIHTRRGDLSQAVATMRRMRLVRDDPKTLAQERATVARLIETDPRWLPRIAGKPQPVEPRDPTVVMHLLKESLPYHQNGFTMRSRYTLLGQRDAGLDPFVVTSLGFPRRDGIEAFPETELVDGIAHHRLDLGPGYPTDPPLDEHLTDYAWLAAKIGRRERPAIIHASSGYRGFDTALVGRALREHLGRPLVYEVRSFFETTWSANSEQNEQGEHYERRYDAENRSMQAADVVITIAEAMRQDIAGRGVPLERIHLMPNGVDPAAFQPMAPDPELVARYRLDGKTVIGYVSTLDHPREGQEVLIEATARLLRRGRKVACLIVGDGKRREDLEALARRAGVVEAVHFTGRIPHEEVRAHYALLDIFVVPRQNDRAARFVTPLKPFEAMAMGKPLVVSDLPALVEIAAPGERGLSFAHGDSEAAADTIETLIDQPELRSRLGEAGREWVLRERTWAANGLRYREIYGELLERWDAKAKRRARGRSRVAVAAPAATPASAVSSAAPAAAATSGGAAGAPGTAR